VEASVSKQIAITVLTAVAAGLIVHWLTNSRANDTLPQKRTEFWI